MPRNFPNPVPKVVRNAEWDYVSTQAKKGAICPFCNQWHAPTGEPVDGGNPCVAVYVRSRQAAIVVAGIPNERGKRAAGERQAPGPRDLDRCLAVAVAHKRGDTILPGNIHRNDLKKDPLHKTS